MWSDEKPFFSLLKQNTHIPSRSTKWIYLALYVFVDHCWTLDCIKCNQIEPGKCVCVSRARVYYWAHPTSTWMAAFCGLLWCLLKKAATCDPLAANLSLTAEWCCIKNFWLMWPRRILPLLLSSQRNDHAVAMAVCGSTIVMESTEVCLPEEWSVSNEHRILHASHPWSEVHRPYPTHAWAVPLQYNMSVLSCL